MSVEFTLVFPAPPNRANATRNWRTNAGNKAKYKKLALQELMVQWGALPREAKKTPWPFFEWSSEVEVYGMYDYDNVEGLNKWPLDVLKESKIIQDDSPKHCRSLVRTKQVIQRKGVRKFYLTIRFVEPAEAA